MTDRIIETERLSLSHWQESDAPSEFELAKDPYIGRMCGGWTAPETVEDAEGSIRDVLMKEECYKICLKDGTLVGCCEIITPAPHGKGNDPEIGYWIGRPYWGNGYAGEACKALLDRAFEALDADRVWISCYDGNAQSRRVIEKCGFDFHHSNENLFSGNLNAKNYTDLVYVMEYRIWMELKTKSSR